MLILSLVIVGALTVVASEANADGMAIREMPGHVSEGTVIVNAPPAEVYALVTNYANWRSVFSDVDSVQLKSGNRDNAQVEFRSRALGRKVTVAFHNEPDSAIRFQGVKGPPGGSSHGEYRLSPIDGGARTLVTGRLFMDVSLPASLVVSSRRVREIRQQKLRADLTAIARYFSRSREQAHE
jgi:hypothetical protein